MGRLLGVQSYPYLSPLPSDMIQIFSLLVFGAHATSAFRIYQNNNADVDCPISSAKPDLNIDRFMGSWFIQEYQYPKEMNMADLSCLMFKFYEDATGIMGNFSFRFPPVHGHFYTIPTKSEIVADGQEGLWLTEFKGVNLLTAVVDTDYDNWAVFVQCMQEDGRNKFLSTRVMSREQNLSADHWLLTKETIQADNLEAEFKYTIDQRNC